MANSSATAALPSDEGYRACASGYDAAPNPMLLLERRYLAPLLPRVAGLDVLDLGCGTGRWLEILRSDSPRSLLGVEPSLEMLRQAKKKLKSAARFVCADGAAAQLMPASADLVLANFVLSYVQDAPTFLANARSALRVGGSLFISDVHPGTSAALQWRRGASGESGFQEIRTVERPLDSVIVLCERLGLQLCARVEVCFGETEKELFAATQRLKYFERAQGYPAIYILQFRRTSATSVGSVRQEPVETVRCIENANIAVGPREQMLGNLYIAKSRIEALGSEIIGDGASARANTTVDLKGFLVLPGLVNAHDHLEFALFPRLGNGDYKNSVEWADDIHRNSASVIAQHRQVPKEVRLWWGGIRNVMCGVTTVSHHNPPDPKVFQKDFVVDVVREYGWAHSLSMDAQAADKKRQTPSGQPFLIHLAEGIDERSAEEIGELDLAGALDKDTVVIHGLALKRKGRELLRSSGAGLVWCPSSNMFLFGRTLSARDLESLSSLALGSDSPLTAEGDLLDEIRIALGVSNLSVETIYNLVTREAAELLKLRQGEGILRVGGVANLLAVRDKGQSPAETLATLSYRDIELVLIGGLVHLASDEMLRRLPENLQQGLEPLLIEDSVRWIRAPLDRLFRETAVHLPDGIFLGGRSVTLGSQH